MSARVVVLDSSAMLALSKREPGFAIVRELLRSKDTTVYAHAVNLCEVFYDFKPTRQNSERSEVALQILVDAGVQGRNDMDTDFWRDMAFLIAERRAQTPRADKPRERARLALGDAFGIALSRRLDAEFITADKTEIEPLQSAGMCRAQFIR